MRHLETEPECPDEGLGDTRHCIAGHTRANWIVADSPSKSLLTVVRSTTVSASISVMKTSGSEGNPIAATNF
jgi:hypothetical protein